MNPAYHHNTPPRTESVETSFDLFLRIEPVFLIVENGRRWNVTEHNHATRLIRDLHRIGREGLRVRGMICDELGCLDRSSIRALNAYLETHQGVYFPRRPDPHPCGRFGKHRFGWYALQRLVGLRWVRP